MQSGGGGGGPTRANERRKRERDRELLEFTQRRRRRIAEYYCTSGREDVGVRGREREREFGIGSIRRCIIAAAVYARIYIRRMSSVM